MHENCRGGESFCAELGEKVEKWVYGNFCP